MLQASTIRILHPLSRWGKKNRIEDSFDWLRHIISYFYNLFYCYLEPVVKEMGLQMESKASTSNEYLCGPFATLSRHIFTLLSAFALKEISNWNRSVGRERIRATAERAYYYVKIVSRPFGLAPHYVYSFIDMSSHKAHARSVMVYDIGHINSQRTIDENGSVLPFNAHFRHISPTTINLNETFATFHLKCHKCIWNNRKVQPIM